MTTPSPLDNITIASPCTADWEAMTGDAQVRHCAQCDMNVYNLSAMTRPEAESLVEKHEGRLCVRFYQRQDGTMLTQDCPVGVQVLYRKKVQLRRAGIAAAVVVVALAGFGVAAKSTQEQPRLLVGAMPPVERPEDKTPTEVLGERVAPQPVNPQQPNQPLMGTPVPPQNPIMGNMVDPQPKETTEQPTLPPDPPPTHIMGKIAQPKPLPEEPPKSP